MNRLPLSLLVIATVLVSCLQTGRANAAVFTISPAMFATTPEFCGDGVFDLDAELIVSSGSSGFASEGCLVSLEPGARLTFTEAHLSGGGGFRVEGGSGSRLAFDGSSLGMELSIYLGYCCTATRVDKQRVSIVDSTVSSYTGAISVVAASGDGGRVEVVGSFLGSGEGVGDSVFVGASTSGFSKKGKALVEDSTLHAGAGHVEVATNDGKTTVTDSTLVFGTPGARITAIDGKCVSKANTPDVPCT